MVDVAVEAVDESGDGEFSGKKKATEQRSQSQSPCCLSYAAILHFKKPSRRRVSLFVRANSDDAVSAFAAAAHGQAGGMYTYARACLFHDGRACKYLKHALPSWKRHTSTFTLICPSRNVEGGTRSEI